MLGREPSNGYPAHIGTRVACAFTPAPRADKCKPPFIKPDFVYTPEAFQHLAG